LKPGPGKANAPPFTAETLRRRERSGRRREGGRKRWKDKIGICGKQSGYPKAENQYAGIENSGEHNPEKEPS